MDRLFGDEVFYEEMVKELLEDSSFDDLEAAMGRGDARAAFMAAHTLRGAAMTLGVVPVGGPAARLTELLRGKDEMSEEARKVYEELKLGLVKVQFAAFGR